MPPEQALGGEVTPQSDLYSLGAMLYELVTGRTPYVGDDPTSVISQHINAQPAAPSWRTEQCPPDLEELVLRLLAKSPDDRPGSAADVVATLSGIDSTQKSDAHDDSNALERLSRGVFVGREQELERLRAAFDRAFSGNGNLVMLELLAFALGVLLVACVGDVAFTEDGTTGTVIGRHIEGSGGALFGVVAGVDRAGLLGRIQGARRTSSSYLAMRARSSVHQDADAGAAPSQESAQRGGRRG